MKAIIFDMGGVLVDLDLQACRDAFKENLGFYEIDEILDLWHQKGIIGDMESGLIGADEFRSYVLEHSRPGARPEEVDEALGKILVGIEPSKVDMLRRLSETYDLYMLSNNNPIALKRSEEIFEEAGFNMNEGFRKCYISCHMKMLKPSEEFFKAVMADIGIPSSEMLFIDDSKANVDAAVEAGLPAVWYSPGSDLAALIEKS